MFKVCPFAPTATNCDDKCALFLNNPGPKEGGSCALRVGPILELIEAHLRAMSPK